jgi:hypothetical protein
MVTLGLLILLVAKEPNGNIRASNITGGEGTEW